MRSRTRSALNAGRPPSAALSVPVSRELSNWKSTPVASMRSGVAQNLPASVSRRRRSSGTPGMAWPSQLRTPRESLTEASTSPSNRGFPPSAVRNPNTATSEPPGNWAESWLTVTSPLVSSALRRAWPTIPPLKVMASTEMSREPSMSTGRENPGAPSSVGPAAGRRTRDALCLGPPVPPADAGPPVAAGSASHLSMSMWLTATWTVTLAASPSFIKTLPVALVLPRRKAKSLNSAPEADATTVPSKPKPWLRNPGSGPPTPAAAMRADSSSPSPFTLPLKRGASARLSRAPPICIRAPPGASVTVRVTGTVRSLMTLPTDTS